jgi:hypothetical protein
MCTELLLYNAALCVLAEGGWRVMIFTPSTNTLLHQYTSALCGAWMPLSSPALPLLNRFHKLGFKSVAHFLKFELWSCELEL